MTALPKIHRVTHPGSRWTWCGRQQNWTTIGVSTDPGLVTCLACETSRVVLTTPAEGRRDFRDERKGGR